MFQRLVEWLARRDTSTTAMLRHRLAETTIDLCSAEAAGNRNPFTSGPPQITKDVDVASWAEPIGSAASARARP